MLEGYSVLDCSDRLGWLAGRVLADLGAEVFKVEPEDADISQPTWQAFNVNKRLVTLDVRDPAAKTDFDALISQVDILILCPQNDENTAHLFDYKRLEKLNSRLIVVSITPFGTEGPRSDWKASDIELMAAGGAMSLAGEPGSTPVRISASQSFAWTGVQAAVGALVALNGRRLTGEGQLVDVSAQAAVLPALAFAPTYWDMNRTIPSRAGSFASGRSIKGADYRAFWPCADGYLNFIVYGGPAGRRTNKRLVEWMQEKGADLGILAEIDWDKFSPVNASQEEVDELEAPIFRFFETITKWEFLEQASAREMLGYPVFTVADIVKDPQLTARSFWSKVPNLDGKEQAHCGSFYMADGERPPLRHGFGDERLEPAQALQEISKTGVKNSVEPQGDEYTRYPLEGVKVVEFGGYAAGPQLGKILANFGATVVHVEAPNRPDGFRLEYPPFKDAKPGLNRGACFAFFNDSKHAVTLDVKDEDGIELARSLVNWADVVVENMRPGVLARMGLGYDTFKETNPQLVMLSTCNMGGTGPRANTPGFGSQLSALAGFSHLTGDPEGPPMLLYGPYIDFIAANFGAAAVLAALNESKSSGKGCRLDLSQYETGLHFIAGALLDYEVNGTIANREVNSHKAAAPHGAYECNDGSWLALSCWSDDEFVSLAQLMGQGELADDPRFDSLAHRKQNEDALNGIVQSWCGVMDAAATAGLLQEAGICAYPVNTVADVFSDRQLTNTGVWRKRRHPVMGEQSYMMPPFELSKTPGDVFSPSPMFGADNFRVFREFIGLDEQKFLELQERGVIGESPINVD